MRRRVTRDARGERGGDLLTALLCGIPLLLAGVAAATVSLFDPPEDTVERLSAASVAVMGIVFGVGFLSLVMPARWEAGARLWRWCGWLLAVAILPFAAVLLAYPATSADRTSRIGSSTGAIALGLLLLFAAWKLGRAWLASARAPRR